jgi:hypothetical protein
MARISTDAFLLMIIDHETARFTLEGPMTNDLPWVHEVALARRAGRHISCVPLALAPDPEGVAARLTEACKRWPSGSIVRPELTAQT